MIQTSQNGNGLGHQRSFLATINNTMTTYLYAKQHNITGLRYFGKTKKDPLTYKGSGTYWLRHLKMHGNNVTTTWYHAYEDKSTLKEEAIFFSRVYDIVDSKDWANLTIETGLDGRHDQRGNKNPNYGNRWSVEQKDRMIKFATGRKQSAETIAKRVEKTTRQKRPKQSLSISGANNPNFGKPMSAETKAKMIATKLAKRIKETE
jgi:hypothetical protein